MRGTVLYGPRDVRFEDFVPALAALDDWPAYDYPSFAPMQPRNPGA